MSTLTEASDEKNTGAGMEVAEVVWNTRQSLEFQPDQPPGTVPLGFKFSDDWLLSSTGGELLGPPSDHPDAHSIQVVISDFENPHNFHFIRRKRFQDQDELHLDLRDFYDSLEGVKPEYRIPQSALKVGICCAAPWRKYGYHRARVEQVLSDGEEVQVLYVDWGTRDKVESFTLCYLEKAIFYSLPRIAYPAKLNGVQALDGEEWTSMVRDKDLCKRFNNWANVGRSLTIPLRMEVKGQDENGKYVVDLVRSFKSKRRVRMFNVARELIREGLVAETSVELLSLDDSSSVGSHEDNWREIIEEELRQNEEAEEEAAAPEVEPEEVVYRVGRGRGRVRQENLPQFHNGI